MLRMRRDSMLNSPHRHRAAKSILGVPTTAPELTVSHFTFPTRKIAAFAAAAVVASSTFALPFAAHAASGVVYVAGGMVPGTSVARAFCPAGYVVTGGGGLTNSGTPAALQQSYPISDKDGMIAWGATGIGWQVAADDWSDVLAFAICIPA